MSPVSVGRMWRGGWRGGRAPCACGERGWASAGERVCGGCLVVVACVWRDCMRTQRRAVRRNREWGSRLGAESHAAMAVSSNSNSNFQKRLSVKQSYGLWTVADTYRCSRITLKCNVEFIYMKMSSEEARPRGVVSSSCEQRREGGVTSSRFSRFTPRRLAAA